MTRLRDAVAGDVGDQLLVRLGGVEDLSAVSAIEAHVWTDDIAPETLEAEVVDPVERTILVKLGVGGGWLPSLDLDDAPVLTFSVEYQATFLDGSVLTWPAGRPDTIVVRADHDPGGS